MFIKIQLIFFSFISLFASHVFLSCLQGWYALPIKQLIYMTCVILILKRPIYKASE